MSCNLRLLSAFVFSSIIIFSLSSSSCVMAKMYGFDSSCPLRCWIHLWMCSLSSCAQFPNSLARRDGWQEVFRDDEAMLYARIRWISILICGTYHSSAQWLLDWFLAFRHIAPLHEPSYYCFRPLYQMKCYARSISSKPSPQTYPSSLIVDLNTLHLHPAAGRLISLLSAFRKKITTSPKVKGMTTGHW